MNMRIFISTMHKIGKWLRAHFRGLLIISALIAIFISYKKWVQREKYPNNKMCTLICFCRRHTHFSCRPTFTKSWFIMQDHSFGQRSCAFKMEVKHDSNLRSFFDVDCQLHLNTIFNKEGRKEGSCPWGIYC